MVHKRFPKGSGITAEQIVELGIVGQELSNVVLESAENFVRDHHLSDNDRYLIASVMTILEGTVFLTLAELLEPEDRLSTLNALAASLRHTIQQHHKETGQ